MLWFLLILLFFGLVFGAIARLLVPGPDPIGLGGTWLLGVVGSLVGGFLGYALFGTDLDDGPFQAAGVIGSIIGSVLVLLVFNAFADRRTAS
jgi:uncharacterized membrane protein YeaQ/YmgE (transglycosylase-associated protein family)